MNKRNQMNKHVWVMPLILLVLLVSCLLWALLRPEPEENPSVQTDGSSVHTSNPITESHETEQFPLKLDGGLVLIDAGSYNGMFMEDGSNEIVSNVFMLQVENSSERDLQYGEITLTDETGTYRFLITNLPAHQQVVLLEQDRSAPPETFPQTVSTQNLAWFTESMSVHEEQFSISGARGVINVKNISDQDIDSDVYVYYKYTADSMLFGGITFRVRVEGGMKAGEIRQISSGHFDPDQCKVMDVTIYGQ